jgi:hypothetical protein
MICTRYYRHSFLSRTRLTCAQIRKSINLIVTIRTRIRTIRRNDQSIGRQRLAGVAAEHIALNEYLIVAAAVDRLVTVVFVEVVVDVLVAEATSRAAGT